MINKIFGKFLYLISLIFFKKNIWKIQEYYEIILKFKNNNINSNIPNIFCNYLIIAEDRKFLKHKGIDIWAILRSFFNNIFNKQKQGGSTIEQQLVRTITNNYCKCYKRKILEIMLAIQLEKIFSKKQIIESYLNIAYLGNNIYGVNEAAQKIYTKKINELNKIEIAEIIARLKYPQPNLNSPKRLFQIKKRCCYILKNYNFNQINLKKQ